MIFTNCAYTLLNTPCIILIWVWIEISVWLLYAAAASWMHAFDVKIPVRIRGWYICEEMEGSLQYWNPLFFTSLCVDEYMWIHFQTFVNSTFYAACCMWITFPPYFGICMTLIALASDKFVHVTGDVFYSLWWIKRQNKSGWMNIIMKGDVTVANLKESHGKRVLSVWLRDRNKFKKCVCGIWLEIVFN